MAHTIHTIQNTEQCVGVGQHHAGIERVVKADHLHQHKDTETTTGNDQGIASMCIDCVHSCMTREGSGTTSHQFGSEVDGERAEELRGRRVVRERWVAPVVHPSE